MYYKKKIIILFSLLLFILISACSKENSDAVTNTSNNTNYKIQPFGVGETPNIPIEGKTGKPYVVRGDTYHPLLSAEGFLEEGIASWYGPNFHGKKTANGEIYNQNALTAAHKYLPMGTYVYVTNLENGKSVRVKINDRGPYKYNRVIDLSKKAAETLGYLDKGLAEVRVSIDKNPKAPKTNTRTNNITGNIPLNAPSSAIAPLDILGGSIYIDLASSKNASEAKQAKGISNNLGLTYRIHNNRIQAGPFVSMSVAERMLAVIKIKFPQAYIIK